MGSKANKATGPKKVAYTIKVRKALELRLQGYSLTEIAKQSGFNSDRAVHIAIKTALERTIREVSEEVRALELARLDTMLTGLWEQAKQGAPECIDRVLKIMQRRASLLGLDMPTKVAPTNPEGDEAWEPGVVYLPQKAPSAEQWAQDVDHLRPSAMPEA